MKRTRAVVFAGVALSLIAWFSTQLHAFVYRIFENGAPIRWNDRFSLNMTLNSHDFACGDPLTTSFIRATAQWGLDAEPCDTGFADGRRVGARERFELLRGPGTPVDLDDGKNMISVLPMNDEEALARTFWSWQDPRGMVNADIVFDDGDPWTPYWPPEVAEGRMDRIPQLENGYSFNSVAAHELGHALGLDHSGAPGVLFGYYVEWGWLTADDLAGLRFLYPRVGEHETNLRVSNWTMLPGGRQGDIFALDPLLSDTAEIRYGPIYSTTYFEPGMDGRYHMMVENLGTDSAGNQEHPVLVDVYLSVDGNVPPRVPACQHVSLGTVSTPHCRLGTLVGDSQEGFGVLPGNTWATGTLRFQFPAHVVPGTYRLVARVDSANEFAESNEQDNTTLHPTRMVVHPRPALEIRIELSADVMFVGEPQWIRITYPEDSWFDIYAQDPRDSDTPNDPRRPWWGLPEFMVFSNGTITHRNGFKIWQLQFTPTAADLGHYPLWVENWQDEVGGERSSTWESLDFSIVTEDVLRPVVSNLRVEQSEEAPLVEPTAWPDPVPSADTVLAISPGGLLTLRWTVQPEVAARIRIVDEDRREFNLEGADRAFSFPIITAYGTHTLRVAAHGISDLGDWGPVATLTVHVVRPHVVIDEATGDEVRWLEVGRDYRFRSKLAQMYARQFGAEAVKVAWWVTVRDYERDQGRGVFSEHEGIEFPYHSGFPDTGYTHPFEARNVVCWVNNEITLLPAAPGGAPPAPSPVLGGDALPVLNAVDWGDLVALEPVTPDSPVIIRLNDDEFATPPTGQERELAFILTYAGLPRALELELSVPQVVERDPNLPNPEPDWFFRVLHHTFTTVQIPNPDPGGPLLVRTTHRVTVAIQPNRMFRLDAQARLFPNASDPAGIYEPTFSLWITDPSPPVFFLRADTGRNGVVDLSDAIATLLFLFHGGPAPSCPDAADANDDGRLTIADPIATLQFLFLGGRPPALPFPKEGMDLTWDDLSSCAPP